MADGLKKRGHEILIITTHCPDSKCGIHADEDMIYRVLHQKMEAPTIVAQILHDILDLNFIARKVKAFDPDIIYLWHIDNLSNAIVPYFSHQEKQIVLDDGSSEMLFINRILKKGIYFENNERDSRLEKWVKHRIYDGINLISFNLINPHWSWPTNMRVYFNSHSSLKFARDGGAPVENAKVIYSGLEITKFPFSNREKPGCPIKLLIPGRLNPIKGAKDSIYLAKELMKKNLEIQFTLVGNIESQVYFDEIVDAIKINSLDKAIKYLPMMSQADLAQLYQESDFCFFPSYQQNGLSRVPLEAMASGSVVITYGNEGSKEIVHDQETGLIVSEGDVVSAAALIDGLINHPAQYKKITRNARKQIESEYTMDQYVDSIEGYLCETSAK